MSEVKVNKISPRTNCGTVTVGDSGDSVTVSSGVPVTVNGDLKSNALKATDGGSIISQSGTTITLGASGDTVTLASGASQTGFGRTGTVDWQTGSIKTGNFTAASGEGYFVNTTSGAITVTLPASPSAGDIVAVADYAGTSATNNITIDRNGSPFESGTENGGITTNRQTATFVYVDGTQGWLVVNSNDASFILPQFVTATGGTVTTSGNFKIHTFTGPGTFTVSCAGNAVGSNSVDYMVIAGGGGGGGSRSPGGGSGGGGAGGWRASDGTASGCYSAGPSPLVNGVSALPVTAQGYPITVGASGPGAPSGSAPGAGNGSNSSFSTITSAGGGFGGSPNAPAPNRNGGPGGSGGGSPWQNRSEPNRGIGNTPPVSPAQGTNGGLGGGSPHYSGGGGGGAGAAGADAVPNGAAGNGGSSVCSRIDGSPKSYAGGGGGGSSGPPAGGSGGGAGAGSGGRPGSPEPGTNASDANRGSGGGGGGAGGTSGGGNGAAGVVVIRYKFQ